MRNVKHRSIDVIRKEGITEYKLPQQTDKSPHKSSLKHIPDLEPGLFTFILAVIFAVTFSLEIAYACETLEGLTTAFSLGGGAVAYPVADIHRRLARYPYT